VYELTADFPGDERFRIDESDSAGSRFYFVQSGGREFTRIAYRFRPVCRKRDGLSIRGCSQSTIALRRKMIARLDYDRIYAAAEQQSKMLSGLRRSLFET
jgi:hypothetical protein